MTTFSQRHGYGASNVPISVREDAPAELRYGVLSIARSCGMSPKALRSAVCDVLLIRPDPNNWTDYPNVWEEVVALVDGCPWPKVYDIAEALWRRLENNHDESQDVFAAELNRLFNEKGIGWELKDPDGIMFRGEQAFATATEVSVEVLDSTGRTVASREVREALADISRRPHADLTGAVQHAMAALEAVARDIAAEPKATLGALVSSLDLPKPLDQAVTKLWGFASERARHLREGEEIEQREAELVVSVACAVATFLALRDTK